MQVDQSQTDEARVEECTASEEPVVHMTQEVIPEPKISLSLHALGNHHLPKLTFRGH